MRFTGPFWDSHWSGTTDRYNKTHRAIWEEVKKRVEMKGRWVDLGCGPASFWSGSSIPFVGVDQSQVAIDKAARQVPGGIYVCADATAVPLASGQFQGVSMMGLLDYFEVWDDVIKEADRLAEPGSPLVITLLQGFQDHDWETDVIDHHLGRPYLHSQVGNWHILIAQTHG